ncbi:hypothetical protein [Methylobacterium tardum]|uniref:hypothetical protein n=1 Tax=Methylobacterium tardum TaxID=374432 RepID=UPI0036120AF0
MAQPSIIPVILSALEPYLDAIEAEWQATPAAQRVPTLPHLPDGKVNVRQLVRDLIDREAAEVEVVGRGPECWKATSSTSSPSPSCRAR